jgi:hypothetical protein
MTILNRDILGRRVQFLLALRVWSDGYTPREWWDAVMHRRGRGFYPRSGPWPIFYYWCLGPIDFRVFTAKAMKR